MISIKGLDKAAVLAALYNRARVQGMGILQAIPGEMTIEEACKEIGNGDDQARMFNQKPDLYFDYLHGRVMKVNLTKDEFEEGFYDRDNGQGAAFDALRNAGLL